jgi:hypothetical protein
LHAANNQGKPKSEAIKALDRNNEAQAGAGKANGKAGGEAANGNSAFGHKQGDAATRTTGSQNNAHGKAESADAHASHVKKATLSDGQQRIRNPRVMLAMRRLFTTLQGIRK